MQIWKYELTPKREQTIEIPLGAEILSVGCQQHPEQAVIWAKVNPNAVKALKIIVVLATGQEYECEPSWELKFIGTGQMGWMVWHVFEKVCLA